MNRRGFLKATATALAAVAVPKWAATPVIWGGGLGAEEPPFRPIEQMTREIQEAFPISATEAIEEFTVMLGRANPALYYPCTFPAISAADVRRRIAELEAAGANREQAWMEAVMEEAQ